MARGIQPSAQQLLEERHMEAVAVLYEAVERDRRELSELRELLDCLHLGLAAAGPQSRGREHFESAARIATRLLRDDFTENGRHRTAVRALQGQAS